MNEIKHKLLRKTAKPRTGRTLDAVPSVGTSGGSSGGTIDVSNFVKKKGEETQKIEGNIKTTGELTAYSDGTDVIDFPIASAGVLGCIKPGENVEVSEDGTLNVVGLSDEGGGIDNISVSGNGNAVTGMTLSADGKVINVVKGATYVTSSTFTDHVGDSTKHITSTERQSWNSAYNLSHSHSNKSYLDLINQALSKTSDVQFGSVKATGEVIAYSDGTDVIDFPIASAGVLGCIKPGENVEVSEDGTLNADSAIKGVQHMANSSSPTNTYTSDIYIRSGYRLLPSGTIAAGQMYSIFLWDATTSRTLSIVANLAAESSKSWRGFQLVCNVGIDESSGVWRIMLYNPTASSIDISGLRVNYTAIFNNN